MGRNVSEDTAYARELGMISNRNSSRIIKRLGGANKLRSLPPDARNIFLSMAGLRDEQPQKIEDK